MQAKDLPEPLTDADKIFMELLTAEKYKRNDVIDVKGRQVIVVRRALE